MYYRVARANEYLIITGYGIEDIKLAKKAFILPGQKSVPIDISPINYSFDVQAMSSEKLPFILPAVFTIGPHDERDSLIKYGKLLSGVKSDKELHDLLKGVIEGETRVLAAAMTMEQIFQGTKKFKQQVYDKVQLELEHFGLRIYNSNIKQLCDMPGHEYFSFMGQRVQQEAANQAKIDVAEAKLKGDTGAKEREGFTIRNAAKVNAETKVYEMQQAGETSQAQAKIDAQTKIYTNERAIELAQANAALETKKAFYAQQTKVAHVESTKNAEIREAELDKTLEVKRAEAEMERLRATTLAKAQVEYEISVQVANAQLYTAQKAAEAIRFKREAEAEAKLFEQQKEAEGIRAMSEAKAEYIAKMLGAFGGNHDALQRFMMLETGTYTQLAEINAKAINGLAPKISVWNGGMKGGSSQSSEANAIADIYTMLPPLIDTIHDQTGIKMSSNPVYTSTPSRVMTTQAATRS
ncbi:hypothetical protein BGX21_002386 [Mortierella sp. AD011]|nr:hypothetical protein BGX20_002826 [Mortierella sp. AD010]KAF9380337.1 hypothetical protein BGX21_002386 [Mortierella sp. AD011]